ncbi:prolyl oligopeptidase family serine peptidase [Corallibacter sp.]|uniref:prolyl oligopeptidase family serine peptidase n=1 Tax=Corallibacter sp. TaxID=2038084 RepID=UPI003AB5CC05
MTRLKIFLFTLLIGFSFFNCSTQSDKIILVQSSNPDKPYEIMDVPYGNEDGQTFDIYLPADRTTLTKTMILIHGGGWLAGDKEDMALYVDFLKTSFPEMAIININYRLASEEEDPYPMQLEDISQLITFLKDNNQQLVISDEFGFIGASAGGHLAMLWAYDFDMDNNIKMVCSVVGPTNFNDPVYENNDDWFVQVLIETIGGENPTVEHFEQVSPYNRAKENAPPTILFYGDDDTLVPPSQGNVMHDKLNQLNVPNELTIYQNEGHGWDGEQMEDTKIKLQNFITTHFSQD